jgi:hypothetical protein
MIISDIIIEGAVTTFGRSKGKVTRKYRCTSGSRKGRIVAKPETCNKPKRVQSSINIKRAKARRGSAMKIASARRKRAGGISQRITRINKSGRRNLKNIRPKTRSRKRSR